MRVIGIDPGLSGSLAMIDSDGLLLEIEDMPTIAAGTKRHLDRGRLVELLDDWVFQWEPHGKARVVLERAGTRPGQSAQSGLKTGIGYGVILGVLSALRIPFEDVTPQAWQKALLGTLKKGESKGRARIFAQQHFPHADLGKRKTEDRSDSLCLAVFGHKQWVAR